MWPWRKCIFWLFLTVNRRWHDAMVFSTASAVRIGGTGHRGRDDKQYPSWTYGPSQLLTLLSARSVAVSSAQCNCCRLCIRFKVSIRWETMEVSVTDTIVRTLLAVHVRHISCSIYSEKVSGWNLFQFVPSLGCHNSRHLN